MKIEARGMLGSPYIELTVDAMGDGRHYTSRLLDESEAWEVIAELASATEDLLRFVKERAEAKESE